MRNAYTGRQTGSRVVLAAVFLVAIAAAVPAINPSHLNQVTFSNNTGYDLHYLFFSPSDSQTWGADILGSDRIFPDGASLSFYIHYPDTTNAFDLLAVDEDGDAYRHTGVSITDGAEAQVEISMDHYKGAYVMPQLVEIELENRTGYEIQYLFVSPADSRMWGVDMLGGGFVLPDGGRFKAMIQLASSPISVDIQALDAEQDTYQFSLYLDETDDTVHRNITLTDLR